MARRRLRAQMNWAVRWGGPAIVLLVAVAYAASWDRSLVAQYWNGHRLARAVVWSGCVTFLWTPLVPAAVHGTDAEPAWKWASVPAARLPWINGSPWAFRGIHRSGTGGVIDAAWVSVPLWPLSLVAILTSIAGWMRLPKGAPGHCPSCRYDLSGLPPGSPCPECATKRPPDH